VAVYTVNRRRAIILLVLSSILLLTLDLRGNPLIDRMRSAFSNILTPFEKAGDVIATPIRNAWHGATDWQDLERENEALREQIAQQRGNDLAARAAYGDYQQLLALSGITTRYPTVTARVVGGAPGNFEQTVEIDRGSSDGIQVGMAVVDFAGMVGKITKVYDDRSVVRLVTDAAYAIECKVAGTQTLTGAPVDPLAGGTSTSTDETTPSGVDVSDLTSTTTTLPPTTTTTTPFDPNAETSTTGTTLVPSETSTTVAPTTTTEPPLIVRETGACQGRGIGKLPAMQYVTENQAVGPIDVGDVITTTGGSTSLAPPDITVGEVINKVARAGSSGPLLEIKLAADLDHLNFVKVIRYVPPNEVPG
jgi:rod shape-determining protein MreC